MIDKINPVIAVTQAVRKAQRELQTPLIPDKEPGTPFWMVLEAKKAELDMTRRQIQALEKPKAALSGSMQMPTAEERMKLTALKTLEEEQKDYLASQGVENIELLTGFNLLA